MFAKNRITKCDGEPPPYSHTIWKMLFLIVNITVWFGVPLSAQEAESGSIYYPWDYGTITSPIILEIVITTSMTPPSSPSVKLIPVRNYGNGTCVPYARHRTGIALYGWAGEFLAKAGKSPLYEVTEVPMVGSIVVTNESNGHIAVVESITEDGIIVSEQNYDGLYLVTERSIPFESTLIEGYIRAK